MSANLQQIRETMSEKLVKVGVDPTIAKPCVAYVIDGQEEALAQVQLPSISPYRTTYEVRDDVLQIHRMLSSRELRPVAERWYRLLEKLGCAVWLPQTEKMHKTLMSALNHINWPTELVEQVVRYVQGDGEDDLLERPLPKLDLNTPDTAIWQYLGQLYSRRSVEEVKDRVERLFQLVHQVSGVAAWQFEWMVQRTRELIYTTLAKMNLEPELLQECMLYVMGDSDGSYVDDEEFPPALDTMPKDTWEKCSSLIYRLDDQNTREMVTRFFDLLYRLGGREWLQPIWAEIKQGRGPVLEQLFLLNSPRYAPLLVEHLDDSAKTVREKVIELLGRYRGVDEQVLSLLKHKSKTARESAAIVIAAWKDESLRGHLEAAHAAEKNEAVKNTMARLLGGGLATSDVEAIETAEQLTEYCERMLKKVKKQPLSWLELENITHLHVRDSEASADDVVRRYLLTSYAEMNQWGLNADAQKIAQFIEPSDLADLAYEVLRLWMDAGAESKKKWVLLFASVHGDHRVITLLKKQIEEWPQNARGAIACEAVRALALSGQKTALMIVDSISRKFKFRQVKEAAASAFAFAAETLGIDPEVLADQVVPDLGFDERGERVLDFGARTFTVRITPQLELVLYDESGKQIKALPKPGKNDDEAKAKAAKDELSAIKKQLKTLVSTQTLRLETALSVDRKWTQQAWHDLFVLNPILLQFAVGLIWGAYVEGELQQSFRYLEDGTFNTAEDEPYELPDGALIGLVHPLELTAEEVEQWKTQLTDYEVTQPFEQVLRPVFTLTEEEQDAKSIERFGGIKLNTMSLLGKLTKLGWYKSSVRDGGWYTEFYKEDKQSGIGAELAFSGASADGYYGSEEDVVIYDLTFYKVGTLRRGSYVYDTIDETKLIHPHLVPLRLFSELLYDVERALVSRNGFDESWKREYASTK